METYSISQQQDIAEEEVLGIQVVYAGGWAVNGKGKKMFIIDNKDIKTGTDVIRLMFEELFKIKVLY